MDIIIVFIIFSALIGYWANNWGRNGWLWFFIALLISPLITAIILLIVGRDKETAIEAEAQKAAAVEKRKKELLDEGK
jgi:sugar phosphate permease